MLSVRTFENEDNVHLKYATQASGLHGNTIMTVFIDILPPLRYTLVAEADAEPTIAAAMTQV
jgi:hypothetical protein